VLCRRTSGPRQDFSGGHQHSEGVADHLQVPRDTFNRVQCAQIDELARALKL